MARRCSISGVGPLSGNKRSHALNATRRKWNVNLQKVTLKANGVTQTVKISARTLKTLKKKGKINN